MSDSIETIPGIAKYWALNNPEEAVFTFVNRHSQYAVFTPRDIYTLAARFASRLRGQYGFLEGDVIANGLVNSPERLITDMGIIFAGCVPVNCQITEVDGADFWNTARSASCRGVIISSRQNDAAYQLFSPLIPENSSILKCVNVTVPEVDTLGKVIVCTRDPSNDSLSLLSSLQSSEEEEFVVDPNPDDLAVLFATSGSSGFCKLVPRSHRQILLCGRLFQGSKNTRYFSDRPFGWMGGFPFDYLAHCSTRILQDKYDGDEAVTSRDLWNVISRHKCHGAAILPSMLMELLQEMGDNKNGFKLSFVITGGQPLRQEMMAALGVLTDAIVVSYGSTEAAMVCVGYVTSSSQYKDYYCGIPVKMVQLKIVDADGNVLGAEEEGEILMKSPQVMTNYYGQQRSSEIFTTDGWYKTSDRGFLDAAGHLYCLGRSGDVFFKGPHMIYASWPESVLSRIIDVDDVQVIGLPNGNCGENLYACVIRKRDSNLTETSLLEAYNASFVSSSDGSSDWPELTRALFFDKFPLTPSGKVNKRELLQRAKEMLEM